MIPSRRECEEALIERIRSGFELIQDADEICEALEAAHRREDSIRALCEGWLHEEQGSFAAFHGIVKILDGDEVKG